MCRVEYLEKTVEDLLNHTAELSKAAQDILLSEVSPVFTESDNKNFLKQPTRQEVLDTLSASNLLLPQVLMG